MTNLDSITTNNTHILGISVAIALHVAGLSLLDLNSKKESESIITPPQPIMVEWVSNTPAKENQPAPSKVEKIQPKVEQNKPLSKSINKTVTKPQPKIQKSIVKPKPLLASSNSTSSTSQMQVDTQEKIEPVLEQSLPKAEPISQSATSTNNQNSAPSSNENEKVPVTLPSLNASYLQNPAPIYPSHSRENGEEGKVLLRVFVNENGKVEKLTVKKSSGYELLDDAAKETVEKWKFVPAKQGDKTIAAWVVVPISFHLEG